MDDEYIEPRDVIRDDEKIAAKRLVADTMETRRSACAAGVDH
jgi:hypothetical protein